MPTLYLDRKNLRLRYASGVLGVYRDEQLERDFPLRMLDRIVLRASVRLDSGLLAILADAGVAVVLFGGRNGRCVTSLHGSGSRDAQRRLGQYALYQTPQRRLAWSVRLLRLKLAAQQRLLRRALQARPDARRPLRRAIDGIQSQRLSLHNDDLTLDQLRGLEGAAAAQYFSGFSALLPPSLEFSGRNRRPPRDPANAVLSLGYTLLHAEAARACAAAGLDPYIGFFHDPAWGRESLAADFIEPLRPVIDHLAWRLFAQQTLRASHFRHDGPACLLDKSGRALFWPAFETAIRPARRALRRAANLMVKQLSAEQP